MKKARFGLGLVVGAVAGIVAGLLTAPKSGKETRDDLKRRATDAKQTAAEKAEDVKGKAHTAAEEAKARAEDLKTRAERVAKTTADTARSEFEEHKREHPIRGKSSKDER